MDIEFFFHDPDFFLHVLLEPYQGIKGYSAAGNDEWLPGAEVHVVITPGKGFWPCWQGNRKG